MNTHIMLSLPRSRSHTNEHKCTTVTHAPPDVHCGCHIHSRSPAQLCPLRTHAVTLTWPNGLCSLAGLDSWSCYMFTARSLVVSQASLRSSTGLDHCLAGPSGPAPAEGSAGSWWAIPWASGPAQISVQCEGCLSRRRGQGWYLLPGACCLGSACSRY